MMNYEADRNLAWRIVRLRRHRSWIAIGSLLCAAVTFIVSLTLPKIYRATTHVMVSESKIGAGTENTIWQYALIRTYLPFVDSDELIQQALHHLRLDRPPYNLTVYRFRKKDYLDVSIPEHSRLLEINVEFPDARIAAKLANYLAQQAVDFNDRLMASDTESTQLFLKHGLDQARERLQRAEAERLKLKEQVKLEDQEKTLNILLEEKGGISTELEQLAIAASQNQARATALYGELEKEPRILDLRKSVVSDPFVQHVLSRKENASGPFAVIEQTLSKSHEAFQTQYVTALADVQAERAGLSVGRAKLAEIDRNVDRMLARLARSRSEIEVADGNYAMAQRAFAKASQDYLNASISVSSKSQDLKQLAPATIPDRSVRPNIMLNTILAAVLALVVLTSGAAIVESIREAGARQPAPVDERNGIASRR